MQLYQFNSEAEIELKAKQPFDDLLTVLKAQKAISVPADGGRWVSSRKPHSPSAARTARRKRVASAKAVRRHEGAAGAGVADRCRPARRLLRPEIHLAASAGERWRDRAGAAARASLPLSATAGLAPDLGDGAARASDHRAAQHAVYAVFGHDAGKMIGSARLLVLAFLGALGGSIISTFLPRSGLALISISGTAPGFALLGASAVIAFTPNDLPIDEVQRLRKLGFGGVFFAVITTFLPGVERAANLGALVVGLSLAGSGAIRAINLRDVEKASAIRSAICCIACLPGCAACCW